MVSDIYFPIPPSPYPAFYPISYPIQNYQSPRPLSSPQAMLPSNPHTKPHDHLYDANRNHVVPYYYSETLTHCMPNNIYGVPNKNRHTVAINPYEERQIYYERKLKSKSDLNTPQLQPVFPRGFQSQSFRPYSVMESSCKSPVPIAQRPSSVVPMSEQYKPASFFVNENDIRRTNEVPEWKARLQKEFPKPLKLDKPLRPICRIPNCKCSVKLDPVRYSEVRTLPTVTERSLNKIRNLSLPTLKLEEHDEIEKYEQSDADKGVQPSLNKPISEQHLGYV